MRILKFLIVVVCLTVHVVAEDRVEHDQLFGSTAVPAWSGTRCGTNAMYILLGLHGIEVQATTLEKYLPNHPDGMSVADLSNGLSECGLPTQSRHCSIMELKERFEGPVIALLKYTNNPNHFVLVLSVKDDGLLIMDGLSGKIWHADMNRLNRYWMGIVIVPVKQDKHGVSRVAWIIASIVAILLFFFLKKRTSKANPKVFQGGLHVQPNSTN